MFQDMDVPCMTIRILILLFLGAFYWVQWEDGHYSLGTYLVIGGNEVKDSKAVFILPT